ncbi:MAG: peptidoglycan-binding protein [Actinobacteria bacterium]|nr:MAG: peptidoglycan-binding protein [Actinomycetota bacterium]
MARMRRAGASLVVAALAAAVPAKGGSTRHTSAAAHSASTRLLHFGSRGSAVAAIQRALGIPADGIFGPQTRAAVVAFQREHGLVVDGIVGPQTRGALARPPGGRRARSPP